MSTIDLPEFGTQPTADLRRQEIARDLVSAAHQRGDFVLDSGERTEYYIDKYLFETRPTILRRLADMLAERVPAGVDRLAADTGGVALVAAVCLATGLPFVIVDDTVKGELHAGERVLVIADVVDTGAQAVTVAALVARAGATVAGVLSVIDRDGPGTTTLAAARLPYEPLYRLSDLEV